MMRAVSLRLFALCVAASTAAANTTTEEAESFITDITQALPRHLTALPHGSSERAMPPDILAYARFFWMVDRVEGNCRYLGQRSNIEMIDRANGASDLPFVAMLPGHANFEEYLSVIHRVDSLFEDLGEPVFCPLVYRLLGPNGQLVEATMRINNFMSPDTRESYEIHPEDGAIWSLRDYCERGFFLAPPANQSMHDFSCRRAEEQEF